jgi:hypothetical protein
MQARLGEARVSAKPDASHALLTGTTLDPIVRVAGRAGRSDQLPVQSPPRWRGSGPRRRTHQEGGGPRRGQRYHFRRFGST